MALTETLDLDIRAAQAQLSRLNAQLDQLSQPLNIPVDINTEGLQRDLNRADTEFEQLNSEVRETQTELRQLDNQADRTGEGILRVGTRGASAFTSLKGSIIGVGVAIAAIQGVRILGNFAFSAIQSASSLEESLSKTNVVFQDLSEGIQDFAATAPEALGLSTAAALEATATFGNLFLALGLSREAAAELSPDIVQLAADLASFNNIAVDEAVEKLRSGLVGEVEPLRTLGVNLNAATVEAKAMALGFTDANGAVTEAGKVQARYALILEQTTTAQGDYARTADGIANRQRTLIAQFENLKVAVGEALLPAFEALLEVAPQLLALIEGLIPAVESFAQSFGDAVNTIQPFLENVTQIQQGIGAVSDAFAASRAVVNQSLELFGSLATLRLDDFFANVAESGDVVGGFIDRIQDRAAITGLANDLNAGAEASEAFATRLQQVAQANDITTPTFDRLAGTAGLTGDALAGVLGHILSNAEAFELDAQAVAFLRSELLKVSSAADFMRGERDTGFDADAIDQEAAALDRLNNVAADFDVSGVVSQIQSMSQGFTGVAPGIENLPDLLSDAREALQSEQGGIVEDFDEFFTNLQTALAARQDFQGNLLVLRAMGLDDLADTFETLGLDSAQALADAITDPTKAAEAERILEAQAHDQASAFRSTFAAELAGMVAVLPVEVQLQQIQIPELQAALNITPFGGGQGIGDIIAGTGTVINNNFYDTPQPTTDTVRITQTLQQIRGAQ